MDITTIIAALTKAGFKAIQTTNDQAIAVYRDRHWSYMTKMQAIGLLQPPPLTMKRSNHERDHERGHKRGHPG